MIYISGNIPSSKNSKQWTGRHLINSKTVNNYLKAHKLEWQSNATNFRKLVQGKEKPYKIGFYFIRDSKRKFDYSNLLQLPQDLMVGCGWLEDDNMENIIPVILGYEVNKEKSGIIISVLD